MDAVAQVNCPWSGLQVISMTKHNLLLQMRQGALLCITRSPGEFEGRRATTKIG